MLIALKRLKLRTSNLTCTFAGLLIIHLAKYAFSRASSSLFYLLLVLLVFVLVIISFSTYDFKFYFVIVLMTFSFQLQLTKTSLPITVVFVLVHKNNTVSKPQLLARAPVTHHLQCCAGPSYPMGPVGPGPGPPSSRGPQSD